MKKSLVLKDWFSVKKSNELNRNVFNVDCILEIREKAIYCCSSGKYFWCPISALEVENYDEVNYSAGYDSDINHVKECLATYKILSYEESQSVNNWNRE